VTLDSHSIAPEVVIAAKDVAVREVGVVPREELGAGFLIIHEGVDGFWLLIDLWHGDILHQHTFQSPLDDPTVFFRVPAGGPVACTWELEIHSHESRTFIEYVLRPDAGPHLEGYLADVLDTAAKQSGRDLVEEFNGAWADRDVTTLMTLMSEDPTYRASTGLNAGRVFRGRRDVEGAFRSIIASEAATTWPEGETVPPNGEVFVSTDQGISFWSYAALHPVDGRSVVIEGVDIWTFEDGKIAVKDAYRKAFSN
jgi:taurine dehydrogenase small subunit